MATAIPSFQQIIPYGLGLQEGVNYLGLTPSANVQWDYRPPADYDPAKAYEEFTKRTPQTGLLSFGAIVSGQNLPSYWEKNPEYLIDPETGLNQAAYNKYLSDQVSSAIAQERQRSLDVKNFLSSTEGKKYVLQQQYDLFSGETPLGELVPTRKYVTDFNYGFNAPSGKYPAHGKKWQEDFTNYYNQFGGPQFGTAYRDETGNLVIPALGGIAGKGLGVFSPYLFDTQILNDIKSTNPELYDFGTKWNEQVKAAQTWPDKLMSRYSLFENSIPQGYVAPEKHKTVKYGAKFGGEPGAQAIGKTNNNPIPNTPGAGLWVYGIDPENPSDIVKAYNRMWGTDANGKLVWTGPQELRQWAPTKAEDGSWKKAQSLDDLYKFGSELDAYYRVLAQKIDLPKRGIMDSIAGKVILGALTSAATGGLGTIVGGLTGSAAAGNLASLGASAAIGGAQGGLEGALTSALGSAVGTGIDQAGGLGNIGDFVSDPFGNIGAAYGLGDSTFSGLNFSGMEEAAQVGPGSIAQVTPPSSIGQNVISTDYAGGIPHEVVEVFADPGDISQLAGGGWGSTAGGAAGSAIGQILTGNGAAGAGSLDVGGLLDTGAPAIGSSGSPTGNIQSVVPGAGTSMGSGQPGATPYGEVGPEGLPTGQPGSYSDASGAGMTGGPQGGLLTDMTDEEMLALAGAGLLGGAALLGGTGSGTTGYGAGGDGTGGDGTGGDGTGGDGNFRFNFPSFDFGAAPQVMGDLGELLSGGKVGAKTKGGKSPYKRIKSPPRRRGITVRRA